MKTKTFTEKVKLNSKGTENFEMKKRRRYRAGKYSINKEVNVEDSEDFIITFIEDGETILDVQCGTNKAKLTLEKLWQGSKGQCINFQGSWLTPNEFQYVSGRETAKDWKRSIRHQGKSIKLLLSKGYIKVTTESSNEEQKKEVQNGEIKKKKRKGKGSRRRKAKFNEVKQPVLVDIPGRINGVIHENSKENVSDTLKFQDGDGTRSESTDESNEGNETDDTIENYYSENEYSYVKEYGENKLVRKNKSLSNLEKPDDDRNAIDCNKNIENEAENDYESQENSNESLPSSINDNGQINSELDLKENVRSEYKCKDSDVEMSELVHRDSSPNSDTSENQLTETKKETEDDKDVQNCISKEFPEFSLKWNTPADDNSRKKEAMENIYSDGDQTSTVDRSGKNDRSSDEEAIDTMPSIIDDIPRSSPTFSETDQENSKTVDSPPVLVPQHEELCTSYKQSSKEYQSYSATDDEMKEQDKADDNVSDSNTSHAKLILSLPLKSRSNPVLEDSEIYKLEIKDSNQTKELFKEPKQTNSIENVAFRMEKYPPESDQMTNSSVDGKGQTNNFCLNLNPPEISKLKRNKRKRLPKQLKKDDKLMKSIASNMQSEISTADVIPRDEMVYEPAVQQTHEIVKRLNSEENTNDQKDLTIEKPIPGQFGKQSNEKNEISLCNIEEENYDLKRIIDSDVIKYNLASPPDKSELRRKSSPQQDGKPLINLKTTVPRQNGEMKKQSRSPLQSSYDDYMRRLEASHSAVTWNPFYPFFQSQRHCNGMNFLGSPFISPYPPLNSTSLPRDSFADSLKTPTSSPLQSPYIATSPPSFEIPRIPSAPVLWNETVSTTESKNGLRISPTSKSQSFASDSSLSCLTIKPAHSAKADSLCSGFKRGSMDLISPLDLSFKKPKLENSRHSEYAELPKHKNMDSERFHSNQTYNSESVSAKKHRKLKHLWINKTDSENLKEEKCSCARKNVDNWSVEQVVSFIKLLDECSPYAEKFRDYSISGRTLQSLTTDHLIRGFGMKVGPAIVLSEAVAREIQNSNRRSISCHYCRSQSLRDEHSLFV